MYPHLTDLQFLVGSFGLIVGLILAVAAFLDYRRKTKPQLHGYFYSEFDQEHAPLGSYVEPGEWEAYYQSRLEVRQAREASKARRP